MKTKRHGLVALAALLACAGPAWAQDVKAVSCSFETGLAQIYGKGTFKSEPASPIAFDVIDIDVAKQTARQTTATNDGPLRVVRAVNALHFIEVAAEGYLNVTTLYDNDPLKGAHPAVHSRHFGILGEPVVSQYQGFCKAK